MLVAASLAAALIADAQFTLTYSGVATSTAGGYTAGQNVTFTFTLAQSLSPTVYYDTSNQPMTMRWSQPGLWTSLTGTGLSGTVGGYIGMIDVSNDGSSTYGKLSAALFMMESADLALNGSPINQIRFQNIPWTGLSIPVLGAAVTDPNAYLSTYITPSTYLVNQDGPTASPFIMVLPSNTVVPISISSVTISNASAVPEPSTYAAIFGALALGAVAVNRQRRRVAAVQN